MPPAATVSGAEAATTKKTMCATPSEPREGAAAWAVGLFVDACPIVLPGASEGRKPIRLDPYGLRVPLIVRMQTGRHKD